MSRYVVSPPGNGWDCLRTWESVLFGAIPIVLSSPGMADLYSNSPVMVVDGWEEVTEDKLNNHRLENINKDVVFVEHWLDKIQEVKKRWRGLLN